jgi:hypothetical protein
LISAEFAATWLTDNGGAFEELVCQLARRQAPDQKSFRRIEGSGGDGGVECVHRDPAGGLVGYQAKYYCKAGDIDWQALDRSVNTALETHPDLSTYVIAVPCDFTGRRRVFTRVTGRTRLSLSSFSNLLPRDRVFRR